MSTVQDTDNSKLRDDEEKREMGKTNHHNISTSDIKTIMVGSYAWLTAVSFGFVLLDIVYAGLVPDASAALREAADFLLELRTRRFEMLTGEYDVYPDGVAMGAAIQKLDQMEASYLSLFTGKTITRVMKRTWFIVPESGSAQSTYPLDVFSDALGFVPRELMEGQPLEVVITPMGKTLRVAGYFSPATIPNNTLLYRIPDLVELKVMLGNEALSTHRISIYQSGQLVTAPVH